MDEYITFSMWTNTNYDKIQIFIGNQEKPTNIRGSYEFKPYGHFFSATGEYTSDGTLIVIEGINYKNIEMIKMETETMKVSWDSMSYLNALFIKAKHQVEKTGKLFYVSEEEGYTISFHMEENQMSIYIVGESIDPLFI